MLRHAIVCCALLAGTATASAQNPEPQPARTLIPEIAASAVGEVKAAPDRATVLFTVETRAATAAAASSENATKQEAVVRALRAAGLEGDQVATVSYTVTPDMQYDERARTSRIVGYIARNTVRAEVQDIARTGAVIDAAIGAGANDVNSLQFSASRARDLRREALQTALRHACADAEAMAAAAGGTLGPLLQASSAESGGYPPPMLMARAAGMQAADTPILPGDITVTVSVHTRWRFMGAGAGGGAQSTGSACR